MVGEEKSEKHGHKKTHFKLELAWQGSSVPHLHHEPIIIWPFCPGLSSISSSLVVPTLNDVMKASLFRSHHWPCDEHEHVQLVRAIQRVPYRVPGINCWDEQAERELRQLFIGLCSRGLDPVCRLIQFGELWAMCLRRVACRRRVEHVLLLFVSISRFRLNQPCAQSRNIIWRSCRPDLNVSCSFVLD